MQYRDQFIFTRKIVGNREKNPYFKGSRKDEPQKMFMVSALATFLLSIDVTQLPSTIKLFMVCSHLHKHIEPNAVPDLPGLLSLMLHSPPIKRSSGQGYAQRPQRKEECNHSYGHCYAPTPHARPSPNPEDAGTSAMDAAARPLPMMLSVWIAWLVPTRTILPHNSAFIVLSAYDKF
jgi:hypothetical protein